MNIHLKSETQEAIKAFSISGIIIVLFYLIISNLDILGGTIYFPCIASIYLWYDSSFSFNAIKKSCGK